jgi:hydroxyacylglutathione hydrolase
MALSPDATLDIVTIPCRTDNYAYLILSPDGVSAALVDAPEAAPIQAELDRRGLDADRYPHHASPPRSRGRRRRPCRSFDASGGGRRRRPPPATGHTMGHIAFHVPAAGAVFTADSLMALGCGRLFEGTAPQMWDSLSKLAALPPETLVCSGHEYTQAMRALP